MNFKVLGLVVDDREPLAAREEKATVVDISERGIGFTTDHPLKAGHLIKLAHKNGENSVGIVMWSLKNDDHFTVGVRLL